MYLMIDNYDSFSHTLSSYFSELGCRVLMVRNDQLDTGQLAATSASGELEGIVISPGPKSPDESGVCLDLVRSLQEGAMRTGRFIPILGVCLGHQVIAVANGARLGRGRRPMHGKVTPIESDGTGLFSGLPKRFKVTRYHSLVVDWEGMPTSLRVDALSDDGAVMAISHRDLPIFGIQFHPEAVLTEHGHELLGNFVHICRRVASGLWEPESSSGFGDLSAGVGGPGVASPAAQVLGEGA